MGTQILSGSNFDVDRVVEKMQPYFGGSLGSTTTFNNKTGLFDLAMLKTSPNWYVSQLDLTMGSLPGRGIVMIPCGADSTDEDAFDTVLNPDGPLAAIPYGTPCSIRKRFKDGAGQWQEILMFVGEVIAAEHVIDAGQQCIKVTVTDARDRLKDVRITGRYIGVFSSSGGPSAYATGSVYYQDGWSSHFNPDGRPNCIFTPGGVPVFSPYPDYGLAGDEEPPDPSKHNSFKACYWTFETMLQHFIAFWGPTPASEVASVVQAAQAQYPENKSLPGYVNWPVGFGGDLDAIALNNFNSGVGQNNSAFGGARKGRDVKIIYGMSLLGNPAAGDPGVLDTIFEAAGGWSWTLQYSDTLGLTLSGSQAVGGNTTLVAKLVRWYSESLGVDMPYGQGNASSFNGPTLIGGSYKESASTMITRAVGKGSLIKIETRVATNVAEWIAGAANPTAALLPAFSYADWVTFTTLAVTLAAGAGGGVATVDSINDALAQMPQIGVFMLNPAFDFTTGTQQAGTSRAPITRPIWPTLLSFQGNRLLTGDVLPYPIRTEVYSLTKAAFVVGPKFEGLETWDDGAIYLPGLIETKLQGDGSSDGFFQWNNSSGGTGTITGGIPVTSDNNRIDVTPVDVRLSIAIPCDQRLRYACAIGSDLNSINEQNFSNFEDSPDSDKLASNFSRTTILDLNGLYELWLRINSYPIPEAAGATAVQNLTTDKSAVRSDVALLKGHTERALYDHYRLDRDGSEPEMNGIVLGYPLGTMINNFAPTGDAAVNRLFKARCCVGGLRYLCVSSKDGHGNAIYLSKTKFLLR